MEGKKEEKSKWIEDFVNIFELNNKEIKLLVLGIMSILHDKGGNNID
jgi:hypothetical protein